MACVGLQRSKAQRQIDSELEVLTTTNSVLLLRCSALFPKILSRAKLSNGLDVLEAQQTIIREPEGRSTLGLANYDRTGGWGKLPARRLYSMGRIAAFTDFHLRSPAELVALKLYFLFVARRGNDTNMANISFDKIEEYTGLERHRIKMGE